MLPLRPSPLCCGHFKPAACSYNEMLRSLSTPSFVLWTASHLFFFLSLFFFFVGSFNCFIPEHTRGLWWLQFWLLISCRPPFLAASSPPVQPASATEEKTHRTFSQTRIEHLLRKHVYKAPGRDILIRGKKLSCTDPKPQYPADLQKA